jgi:hypothetical protein
MNNPWIVLAAIVAVSVVYVLLPVFLAVFARFRAKRRLTCPESGMDVEVGVDAARAGLTGVFGLPRLRVKSCSLWPTRSTCGQGCLSTFEKETPAPVRRPAV